jgi:F0F1-type ATP synthase assembly protein I
MSKDPLGDYSQVMSLGFTLVAYVLVFTAIGYGLDRWLHTTPWLMVAGVFVGAGFGFLYLVRILFSTSSGGKDGGKGAGDGRQNGPGGRSKEQ